MEKVRRTRKKRDKKEEKDGKGEKDEAAVGNVSAGTELAVVTQDTKERTQNLRNSTLSCHSKMFLLP